MHKLYDLNFQRMAVHFGVYQFYCLFFFTFVPQKVYFYIVNFIVYYFIQNKSIVTEFYNSLSA